MRQNKMLGGTKSNKLLHSLTAVDYSERVPIVLDKLVMTPARCIDLFIFLILDMPKKKLGEINFS